MRLIFDIETNGFLENVTKIHCISTVNIDTNEVKEFRPNEIKQGIEFLKSASYLAGHNIIKFDIPVIEKLHGVNLIDCLEVYDTLVAARLIFANVKDKDIKYRKTRKNYKLPPKLIGSHSLEAWGYRLGDYKGDFGKDTDWQNFDESMLEYCTQDTLVNFKLWRTLKKQGCSEVAIKLEHDAAIVLAKQERNGFCFDEPKAIKLYSKLSQERADVERELSNRFDGWWKCEEIKTPKRTIRAKKDSNVLSTVKGAPYSKIKWIDFNPSSRQHIIKVLTAKGWRPKVFTDSGQPKIDETILSKMPYEEAPLFLRQFLLQKRIGQIAEGKQAWLKVIRQGKIHGSVNPNGAVTGRATHSYPNVAQVPSARSLFGKECRELWTVPKGWVLFGTDASGLELRCLAHFMAKWDNGAYANIILNGDIHTANQEAAGLPSRDDAKVFIYSWLYGAGDILLGAILEPNAKESRQRKLGKQIKEQFLRNIPALAYLRKAVTQAAKRGYLIGLDGRKVYVRYAHAALNTLLQSAGALICKQWIVEVEKLALDAGLIHGWQGDFAYCAWVHDEVQIACRTQMIAEQMAKFSKEAMQRVEKGFSFRCPLDTDSNIGANWCETH